MRLRSITIAALLTTALFTSGRAQFLLETGLRTTHDDNISNSGLGLQDVVTEMFLNAGYEPAISSGTLQFHYMGAFDYFRSSTDRSFAQHLVGGVWTRDFDDETGMLNLGLSYTRRDHRTELSFADYSLLSFYSNVRWALGDDTNAKLGYRLRGLAYTEMADLNNTEHSVFGQLSHQFPTLTTVFAEMSIGRKSYTNAVTTTTGGMRGLSSDPSTTIAGAGIRVSQPVFAATGMHIGWRTQSILSADQRYFADGYLVSDDEIFDSRYGYEGSAYYGGMTQILWGMTQLSLDIASERKGYLNRPVEDWDGNVGTAIRSDLRTVLSLGLETPLARDGFLSNLTLSTGVDVIRNASNDVRYDYRNTVFSVQLSYGW
jgi:hypothetical protein